MASLSRAGRGPFLISALAALVTAALATAVLGLGALALPGTALAAQPEPWRLGLQEAATPIMHQIADFHNLLLIIITAITLFVLVLLLFVIFRFSEKRNPTPSKTTHNTVIEIVWTVVPVMILAAIVVPSFKLLYAEDVVPEADMTVKAIGRQWYWSYEYPDNGAFTFDSYMTATEDLAEGEPRLLTADNALVLPVDTTIRVQVTASDVLHDFAVPAFGTKLDAVPGRLNETWVKVEREGTYYGQCSELCGTGHAYMPIMVKVVSKEAFAEWVEQAKQEYASVDEPRKDEAETIEVAGR